MSMRYKGGVLSATAPVTSSSSATGMWTMRQQLQAVNGTGWPKATPVIGSAYEGGFFAGQINVSGTIYNLVIAPKSSGEASGKAWGTMGVSISTSVINGPANTSTLNGQGVDYQAAQFCAGLNAGSGLNGKTDWYMPAKNELEVLYYFLKPTTTANSTTTGANANAVSPEPISTDYSSGSPAQTAATDFQSGGVQAFASSYYWTSTQSDADNAWRRYFLTGGEYADGKDTNFYVRAVRRVPV